MIITRSLTLRPIKSRPQMASPALPTPASTKARTTPWRARISQALTTPLRGLATRAATDLAT